MMPSPYTSQASLDDALEAVTALGASYETISIEPAMGAFGQMLASAFGNRGEDTTEENIQARARGLTLMALSNKFGHMVLSTGNKSEMSVGYATLYGDMCGGYNVLKDVYKTTVFALCGVAQPQPPGRRARARRPGRAAEHHRQAALGRIAPDQTTRTACRPTMRSTTSWNA